MVKDIVGLLVVVFQFICWLPVAAIEPPRVVRILNAIDLGAPDDTTAVGQTYLIDKGWSASIQAKTTFNVYRETWPLGPEGPSVRLLIGEMTAEVVAEASTVTTFVANYGSISHPVIKYKVPMQGDLAVPGLSIDAAGMFDPGRFELKPGAATELKKVADWVRTFQPQKLRIEGHTDSDGPPEANLRLSTLRAEAVEQALISQYQLNDVMLSAVGFGEQRPRVSNSSDTNKAMNRRIEVVIFD